jgi:abortive infection bacteriophage resistance protein
MGMPGGQYPCGLQGKTFHPLHLRNMKKIIRKFNLWVEVQGVWRAETEIVRGCTARLRALRNAEIRPKIGFN